MTDRNACIAPVRAATQGLWSDEDIDRALESLIARKARVKAKIPALSEEAALRQAAAELTQDEVKAALISQRARAYGELAKKGRLADYAKMSGTSFDKLEAMTIGSDKAGFGGRNSVDAMGEAMRTELLSDMERQLRKAGLWSVASGVKRDPALQRDIVIEMARLNGGKEAPTKNEVAEKAAKVMVPLIEKGRAMQNGVGAWIGKLDGYVARQNHDPIKVAGGFWRDLGKFSDKALNDVQRQAFKDWHDVIRPLLHDKTFEAVGAGTEAERRKFLEGVWFNIVTGDHSGALKSGQNDVEGFLPKAGKARAVSAERVLHFKSAADWWTYHQAFGKGDLFGVVVNDLSRAARNTALMKRFGPAPEIAWNNDVQRFVDAARDAGDANLGKKLKSDRIQSAFRQVAGLNDAPENLRLAHIGQLIRKHESVSKLGSMVLSAFPDMGVASNHLMQAGVPVLNAYGGVLSGVTRLGGNEARMAAELLDAGAKTAIGHMTAGVSPRDGAMGFYTLLGRLNYALQGFDFWNDGIRAGVGTMFSKHMADHAGVGYDALPGDLRGIMQRYGIDKAGWDQMRGGVTKIEDGHYIGFDHLDGDLNLRARAMINDIMDNATSEARGRERRDIALGTTAGTRWGEAVRAFMQFKSFPMTYFNRTLMPAVNMARAGNVAPLANLIVSTMLLGYVSLQAKQLAAGKEPRPLDWRTVMGSMVQGGGLGIYGDFLFGERNRFGGGLAETFGGPVVGDFTSLLGLYDSLRQGKDATGQAFRLAKGNIPLANLWYTRAALDYTILWRMQEAISPGWAARYQRNVERQNGSSFWLKPTDAVH